MLAFLNPSDLSEKNQVRLAVGVKYEVIESVDARAVLRVAWSLTSSLLL